MTIAPGATLLPAAPSIRARRVAALAADGVDEGALAMVSRALGALGATVQVVGPRPGSLKGAGGAEVRVDLTLVTTRSLDFDAIFVPDGEKSVRELRWDPRAWVFLTEACERGKAILAVGCGVALFEAGADDRRVVEADGRVLIAPDGVCERATRAFIEAIAGAKRIRTSPRGGVAVAQFL